MPFKTKYISAANPVWPMTLQRASAIYKTVGRAIRDANPAEKEILLEGLVEAANDLDRNCVAITANQTKYDEWIAVAPVG